MDNEGKPKCVCNEKSGYKLDPESNKCVLYDPCVYQSSKKVYCYSPFLGLENSETVAYCKEGYHLSSGNYCLLNLFFY